MPSSSSAATTTRPACPAPAAPTRRWPTRSPRCTSPTGCRTSASTCPGCVVHCVPQMLTVEATLEALDEADRTRSLDRTNLLLTHPRITPGRARATPTSTRSRSTPALLQRRPRAARPLPRPHRRSTDGIWYAGSHRHVHLRRRPRPAQGHRRARHRHGRVPPRARSPASARSSPSRRSTPLGLSPAEVQSAGARAGGGGARRARWPACSSTASTPRPTACSTSRRCARPARRALHLKLEPQLRRRATHMSSCPTSTRWPPGGTATSTSQDLTGYDRDRSHRPGPRLPGPGGRGVGGLTCSSPASTCATTASTRTSSTCRSPPGLVGIYGANGAGKSCLRRVDPLDALRPGRAPTSDDVRTSASTPTASPRSSSSTRATSTSCAARSPASTAR